MHALGVGLVGRMALLGGALGCGAASDGDDPAYAIIHDGLDHSTRRVSIVSTLTARMVRSLRRAPRLRVSVAMRRRQWAWREDQTSLSARAGFPAKDSALMQAAERPYSPAALLPPEHPPPQSAALLTTPAKGELGVRRLVSDRPGANGRAHAAHAVTVTA